jgi:Methyltransferase domain
MALPCPSSVFCSFLTVIPTEVEGPRHDCRITQLAETISPSPTVTLNKAGRLVPSLPASGISVAYNQRMSNPWLAIALKDYEGHMGSDNVRQLAALSDLFKCALDLCAPESVAVVGVAGGNGLERVYSAVTKRIVGLDVNARYLAAVRQRYATLPGLELCCADLADIPLSLTPVELVHAALVFEHTGLGRCLENTLPLVAPGGKLSVVLQLPSAAEQGVTPTRYASMQALRDSFALIDVSEFCRELEGKGFRLFHQEQRSLPAGKAFWHGIFGRGTQ